LELAELKDKIGRGVITQKEYERRKKLLDELLELKKQARAKTQRNHKQIKDPNHGFAEAGEKPFYLKISFNNSTI